MGVTAALNAVVVSQPMARPRDHHRLGAHRLSAHLGPCVTILGGPIGLGPPKTARFLWFRDRQFLFTSSPYTKES